MSTYQYTGTMHLSAGHETLVCLLSQIIYTIIITVGLLIYRKTSTVLNKY